MRLITILVVAILSVCAATYQPAEMPSVEADTPTITTQQEQGNTPAVIGETHPDVVVAPPVQQESDMVPATDTTPASAGMAEPIVEPAPTVEEPIIIESAKTDIPAVVEHAKTGGPDDVPVVVEHAKTGYEGEDTTPAEPPVIEPERPTESANIDKAIAAAEAFAIETYNVTIDPSLDFNNSAYRFPAAALLDASQEFLNNKAIDIVNYTFQQQIRQFGVSIEKMRDAGIRCRIYVEQTENNLLVYCFYA